VDRLRLRGVEPPKTLGKAIAFMFHPRTIGSRAQVLVDPLLKDDGTGAFDAGSQLRQVEAWLFWAASLDTLPFDAFRSALLLGLRSLRGQHPRIVDLSDPTMLGRLQNSDLALVNPGSGALRPIRGMTGAELLKFISACLQEPGCYIGSLSHFNPSKRWWAVTSDEDLARCARSAREAVRAYLRGEPTFALSSGDGFSAVAFGYTDLVSRFGGRLNGSQLKRARGAT